MRTSELFCLWFLLLTGCCLLRSTCPTAITTATIRDPATGIPVVSVFCGARLLDRAACYDGGSKRRTADGWDILCDGHVLRHVALPKDVTP